MINNIIIFFQENLVSCVLAIIFVIWQFSILLLIRKAKKQILKKMISPSVLKATLSSYEDELNSDETSNNSWLKVIYNMFGRNTSINEVKNVMHSHFDQDLNTIRTYSNQGPAIGVLSTFSGLAIILLNSESNNLASNLAGLTPMISGSIFGIIVFYIGNLYLNNLNHQTNEIIGSYLAEFFIFEKEHNIGKIQGLEGVYQKLLQPMTEILDTFKKVKTNFNKFDKSYATHIVQFGEMINQQAEENKNYLTNLSQSFNEHLTNLNSGLSSYFERSNQNIDALNLTIAQLNNFKETIDYMQNQVGASMQQLEVFVGSTDNVREIVNSLGESIGTMLKVSDSIDKISEEVCNQNRNINTLVTAYDDYAVKVQENFTQIAGFKESVNDLNKNITLPLSYIGENIEQFPTKDLVTLTNEIKIIKESITSFNQKSAENRHAEMMDVIKEIATIKDAILAINTDTNEVKHSIAMDFDYSKLAEALNQQATISKSKSKIAKLKNFGYQFTVMTTAIVIGAILIIGTANYFDWVLK